MEHGGFLRRCVMKKENMEIKMFLSSTFDHTMRESRDLFRNELRMELDLLLGKYECYLYLYDYELGIPKGTPAYDVMDRCLDAVADSSYFIGILGSYYGTPVQSFLEEEDLCRLASARSCLKELISENASVLELEFAYAVQQKNLKRIFFIAKDLDEKNSRRSVRLRKHLEQHGCRIMEFSVVRDIKQLVIEYFQMEASARWKQKNVPWILHAVYNTKYYVKDPFMEQLWNYCLGNSRRSFLVNGPAGSGKSTLLSMLCMKLKGFAIISVFVGGQARTLTEVLGSMLWQLHSTYKLHLSIPANGMESEFLSLMRQAVQMCAERKERFLFIVDGYDQIRSFGGLADTYWIPDLLPVNVKIILSCRNTMQRMKGKGISSRHNSVSGLRVVKKILQKEGKDAEAARVVRFLYLHSCSISPVRAGLFVREVMACAKYDTLNAVLKSLRNSDLSALYCRYLGRLIRRFHGKEKTAEKMLVFLACSRYGLSRQTLVSCIGVYDGEIINFMYQEIGISPDERFFIRSLYLKKAVLLFFKVTDIRRQEIHSRLLAVCRREAEEDAVAARELLFQAEQMKSTASISHILSEPQVIDSLMYEGNTDALYILKNIADGSEIWKKLSQLNITVDSMGYMLSVVDFETENGKMRQAGAHLQNMEALLELGGVPDYISYAICSRQAALYAEMENWDLALKYFQKGFSLLQKDSDIQKVILAYGNLAAMYFRKKDFVQAEQAAKAAFHMYQSDYYFDSSCLLMTSMHLVMISIEKGDFNYAKKELRRLSRRYLLSFKKGHPHVSYLWKAGISFYNHTGKRRHALKVYRSLVQNFPPCNAWQAYSYLILKSDIYLYCDKKIKCINCRLKAQKYLPELAKENPGIKKHFYAMLCYDYTSAGIAKKAVWYGKKALAAGFGRASCLAGLAAAYELAGNYQKAFLYYKQAIDADSSYGDIEKAIFCNGAGSAAAALGLWNEAYDYYRQGFTCINRVSGCMDDIKGVLFNNLGDWYHNTEEYEKALYLYFMALDFYRQKYGLFHAHCAMEMDNIGSTFDQLGKSAVSMQWHIRGLAIRYLKLGGKDPGTITSLHNLAEILVHERHCLAGFILEVCALYGQSRIGLVPDSYALFLCMGDILSEWHFKRKAYQAYSKAWNLIPKIPISFSLIRLYLLLATERTGWEERQESCRLLRKAYRLVYIKNDWKIGDWELLFALSSKLSEYYRYTDQNVHALFFLNKAYLVLSGPLLHEGGSELLGDVIEAIAEIASDVAAICDESAYNKL